MSLSRQAPSVSHVSAALASDRLGVPAVIFFVMSAATPFTVVAGVITTAYALTGVTGIPLAFVVVGAILALFSVGYVAMSRYVANAGAFYAYIARGIGRPAGVGAAWVALLAYNALQVGLYGAIGAAAAPLLEGWFGLTVAWWVFALVAWVLVAVLGVLRVDVNSTVLAVLLVAEVAVIVVFDAANLLHPAGGAPALDTLSPANLFVPGLGAALVVGVLGFVGFESSVVFSEESRDPRRTIPIATYASVAVIAALYALSAWAMSVAAGDIVATTREQGPETVFNLAGAQLGTTAADIGHALFLTSLVAAMISFHNTTARYMYALGREGVLPAPLGRTSPRTSAPKTGSLVQSAVGLVVIALYAVAGWDPLVQLFFWLGTSGGFGVLLLMTITSVAVIAFFARARNGAAGQESAWRRVVAPALATVALAAMVVLAIRNFADLLGVGPDHPMRWIAPGVFLAAAVLGLLWGMWLRGSRPDVYSRIGLGARTHTSAVPPGGPAGGRATDPASSAGGRLGG